MSNWQDGILLKGAFHSINSSSSVSNYLPFSCEHLNVCVLPREQRLFCRRTAASVWLWQRNISHPISMGVWYLVRNCGVWS